MRDNLDLKICTNANGLDFRKLAILAEAKGVTFEKVCERAESGITDPDELTRVSMLRPTAQWITPEDCRKILRIGTTVWAGVIAKHPTAIYWGLRAKTRSTLKPLGKGGKGARGCGALYYKPDIERLAQIKHQAGLSFATALKVFFAMSEGRI